MRSTSRQFVSASGILRRPSTCRPCHSAFSTTRKLNSETPIRSGRPFVCNYHVRRFDKTVRIEAGIPSDKTMLVEFLNRIVVERHPTCRSTADEFRPFTEFLTQKGLEEPFSLLAFYNDELVAASIGNRAKIDRSLVVEARVRDDYKDVIDELEKWLPSRRARRVVGPAHELTAIVNNFLPADVNEVLRLELSGVRADFVGGNIVRKLLFEQVKIGLANGLLWADGHTSAKRTERAGMVLGFTPVFSILFDRMYDNKKRIHRRVPLLGGSTRLTLFVGRTDEIVANKKF